MADNSSTVTITLPSSPAVGDIIQVNGVGSGGWTIALNSSPYQQSIITANIGGSPWAWTAGTLSGGQYDAIELQYIGGSTFSVLNNEGSIAVTQASGYVNEGGLIWTPVWSWSSVYTWPDANTFCSGMGLRLPTEAEMNALYNSGALNGQGWWRSYTWSSTYAGGGNYYNVHLSDNYVNAFNGSTFSLFVTCVR
jgi:hypothetical protein